ncbi:coiled-coil domain-containing protein 172-like [Diretmus argenteus]
MQTQQMSEMRLQHDVMKKCEEQMEKQIQELICQRSHLMEDLDKIKKESKQEEEKFLQEIMRFNSHFSLHGNRVFDSQTQSKTLDLDREVESLYKEMELMCQKSSRTNSMQEEKRALQLELQGLDNNMTNLDLKLSEAEAMTESLRAESLIVSQKPLTDSTCLRLKKELGMHKEGELELLREALSSEIQFLQSAKSAEMRTYGLSPITSLAVPL